MIRLNAMACYHRRAAIVLSLTALLSACASVPVDQIALMPAPDVYGDGMLNPLPEANPFDRIPYDGILFATDRTPATGGDPEQYYRDDRGQVVRLGLAEIQFGKKEHTWKFARDISMLKSRSEEFPVKISNVEEWGIMGSSIPYWFDVSLINEDELPPDATDRFADAINAQLAVSKRKHVYIYTHGYGVVYENPVLVSAELWHFLGYDGAFIAYAWPSTPSRWAYIKDSDTSAGFARNFRLLIEFVAENTDAEEIHVIGYSNGTRLVSARAGATCTHSPVTRRLTRSTMNCVCATWSWSAVISIAGYSDPTCPTVCSMSRSTCQFICRFTIKRLVSRSSCPGASASGNYGVAKAENLSPVARQALIDFRDQISFINVSEAEGAEYRQWTRLFSRQPVGQ